MTPIPSQESSKTVDDWTKPPFLRRVRIRGYKSIAFCDVALEPLTILVGRNGAGKSNFLDALTFMRDCLATNIPEATKRHGGWHSMLSRLSPCGEISFEVEMSLLSRSLPATANPPEAQPSARYGFVLKEGPMPQSPVLVREWFWSPDVSGVGEFHYELSGTYDPARKDVRYTWTFRHPEIDCSQVPYPRPDRLWIASFGRQPFRDLGDELRYMAFYNFIPKAMRDVLQPTFGQLLDQHGQNLASVLDDTRQNDPWAFHRIGSYLSAVVPEVERFDAVRYGEFETIHFWLGFKGTDKKLDFDAASMSDGTLRVLAALMAAFQVVLPHKYPNVVGIEEPESALHPAAMRALVDALDEATMRTQVLLTTHSADMLDNPTIRPENVRVVQMIEGQTVIGPVDEAGVEIVARKLNSLGGLEREDQLEPDLDDQDRQRELAHLRPEDGK